MATSNGFTLLDHSNEKSNVGMFSTTLTAANFDAEETLFAAVQAAILNLTTGTLNKTQRALVVDGSSTPPTDPYSQRELKWLVTYTGDVSGKSFQIEIPTPDLVDNLVAGSDLADLSSTDWAAFITAFEAFAASPDDDTESVTVVTARLVGRNI